MKKTRRHVVLIDVSLFFFLIYFIYGIVQSIAAGVVLTDDIYLFKKGNKIQDNSVVMELSNGFQSVCEYGKCVKTVTEEGSETVVFYQTDNAHILHCFVSGRPACDQFKSLEAYQSYLKKNVAGASRRIEMVFPEPSEEEKKVDPEEWVKTARCFRLDIDLAQGEQVMCSQFDVEKKQDFFNIPIERVVK